jgi:hypothetical protein
VTSWLAHDHPDRLKAIHLNMHGLLPWRGEGAPPMTEEEAAWIQEAQAAQPVRISLLALLWQIFGEGRVFRIPKRGFA